VNQGHHILHVIINDMFQILIPHDLVFIETLLLLLLLLYGNVTASSAQHTPCVVGVERRVEYPFCDG
jgi:hypothetical protein